VSVRDGVFAISSKNIGFLLFEK
jgi:hypothetical protein